MGDSPISETWQVGAKVGAEHEARCPPLPSSCVQDLFYSAAPLAFERPCMLLICSCSCHCRSKPPAVSDRQPTQVAGGRGQQPPQGEGRRGQGRISTQSGEQRLWQQGSQGCQAQTPQAQASAACSASPAWGSSRHNRGGGNSRACATRQPGQRSGGGSCLADIQSCRVPPTAPPAVSLPAPPASGSASQQGPLGPAPCSSQSWRA